MAKSEAGILAIWNDCAAGREAAYEAWYQGEHLLERVGLDGFHFGRRYEAVAANRRFFTFYELDNPAVPDSPVYQARLNDPTPMTREIMSGTFKNMVRGLCRRTGRVGRMSGAYAVTARFETKPKGAQPDAILRSSFLDPVVMAGGEAWEVVRGPARPPSVEAQLRGGGDRGIEACVLVTTLRERDAMGLREAWLNTLGDGAEIGVYRLLCELRHEDAKA